MAQRILKNNTASPVPINDTGDTVPASGQLTIAPLDYGKYEGSSDVLGPLTDQAISTTVSTLTANDGTFDLAITDGVRLIQGGFYLPISDGDNPTIKANVVYRVDGVKALAVDDIDPVNLGTPIYIDGKTPSTPSVQQTLATFLIPVGKSRILSLVNISSSWPGVWDLDADSVIIASGRVSPGHPESIFEFTPRRIFVAGTTLTLKFTSRAGPIANVDYHLMTSEV